MFWFFTWRARRRYRKLLSVPLPESERDWLGRGMPGSLGLDPSERERLSDLVRVLLVEANWQGCGGLELDDAMKVIIAAQACVPLIGFDAPLYHNVESILVYPSTVVPRRVESSMFAVPGVVKDPTPLLGEAHQRGPLILAWDSAVRDYFHPEFGRNVVVHEFAHKLDMLDGYADGVPPLLGRAQKARFVDVCTSEYEALRARTEGGLESFLDPYAASNRAEFFAVASEAFFSTPLAMLEACPELHAVLADLYRQDPALRLRRWLEVV